MKETGNATGLWAAPYRWVNRLRHRLHRSYPARIKAGVSPRYACVFLVGGPREAYAVRALGNETRFLQHVLRRLGPPDVFLDVGASIGLFTLPAARACRSVVALEPDPARRARLEENVRLNGYRNVEVRGEALAERDGELLLHTSGVEGPSGSLHPHDDRRTVPVAGRSLDSLLEEGMEPPTVVKMDIEGAEWRAVQGMENFLGGDHAPRLLAFELHPRAIRAYGGHVDDLMKRLGTHGYHAAWGRERGTEHHVLLTRNRGA